jgi:hypothetical protein
LIFASNREFGAAPQRKIETGSWLRALGEHLLKQAEQRRWIDAVLTLSPFEVEVEKWLGSPRVLWVPRTIVGTFGALPPDAVHRALLSAGVNVLAVVQSFDPLDGAAHRLNFPSKLTEYTTFGLPVLVVAPHDASVATWLRNRSQAAILVSEPSPERLSEAIVSLNTVNQRINLAAQLQIVAKEFDPGVLSQKFHSAINKALASGRRVSSTSDCVCV